MSRHLKSDLERLEKRLLLLGSRVEDSVRKAIRALLEGNEGLAQDVIDSDHNFDNEEVEVEEDCLKILALHQPVANDLRFVTACLKINSDVERIGDLAVNIAERAQALRSAVPMPPPPLLAPMMEETTSMLRFCLDSFVRGDVRLARKVLRTDASVDDMNRRTILELIERMRRDSSIVEPAILYLSASKNLERIADHATNIAEDVVYMVEGDIIRHEPPGDASSGWGQRA